MSDFFPFSLNDIAAGPARVMYAPTTVAVPVKLSDIFDNESPYTPTTGWLDFGATSGPTQISRNITSDGFNIQQSTSTILEEITDTSRTVTIPVAELTAEVQEILEESSGIVSVAATAGTNIAQRKTPFGSIFDLSTYRIAVVYRFKKSQGTVVEAGTTRGRAAAWVGYRATLTADNTQISIGEGELVGGTLTFKLDADPTVTAEGSEQGFWIYETAGGTIG